MQYKNAYKDSVKNIPKSYQWQSLSGRTYSITFLYFPNFLQWAQISLNYCKKRSKVLFIMRNAGLDESKAGIKTARRNINNLRQANDTTLMAESIEELKSVFMKVKVESEKSWLKNQHSKEDHGIWFHHFIANRWGNNGNSNRLFSWASKSL